MVSWRGPSAHIDITPEPWLIEAAKAVDTVVDFREDAPTPARS